LILLAFYLKDILIMASEKTRQKRTKFYFVFNDGRIEDAGSKPKLKKTLAVIHAQSGEMPKILRGSFIETKLETVVQLEL
jgi:hypothetical protein